MALSLKVPVQDLIVKVEAERERIIKTHEKAVAEWDAAYAGWHARAKAALQRAYEKGKYTTDHTYDYKRHVNRCLTNIVQLRTKVPGPGLPDEPGSKPNLERVDRDLRLLKATSQDTITVRADSDLSRYL